MPVHEIGAVSSRSGCDCLIETADTCCDDDGIPPVHDSYTSSGGNAGLKDLQAGKTLKSSVIATTLVLADGSKIEGSAFVVDKEAVERDGRKFY